MKRTWIYKRSHLGDPCPRTGIFGCHDCEGTHRSRRYDNVIGIWGTVNWERDKSKANKLSWIGINAHRLTLEKEVIELINSALPTNMKKWRGQDILAFDRFQYYEHGHSIDIAPNLVTVMRPMRMGGRFCPNLPKEAQQEVGKILELAEGASPSLLLHKLDELVLIQRNFQHLNNPVSSGELRNLLMIKI